MLTPRRRDRIESDAVGKSWQNYRLSVEVRLIAHTVPQLGCSEKYGQSHTAYLFFSAVYAEDSLRREGIKTKLLSSTAVDRLQKVPCALSNRDQL